MDSFRPLGWCIDSLDSPAKTLLHGVPDAVRATRYPFRLLRYWFVHELLVEEGRRRACQSLHVAEIGIDAGQMLSFSSRALDASQQPRPWQRWHGLDCSPQTEQLRGLGYDAVTQLDLEDPHQMAQQPREAHDAIILLHVVEHLHDPARALEQVSGWLKPGGVIIGGAPGTPEFARERWQRRLRRTARPRGHVSVLSADLVRRWGTQFGLETELLNGAFFMRKKGFALENHAWWLKANPAFGALFPGWPGELYWSWRKPGLPAEA